jgi:hypothetical protein
MTKPNKLEIDTKGRPVNEVYRAAFFKEITPEERMQAAEDLDALIADTHNELFGGDE